MRNLDDIESIRKMLSKALLLLQACEFTPSITAQQKSRLCRGLVLIAACKAAQTSEQDVHAWLELRNWADNFIAGLPVCLEKYEEN